ncbi:MAG: TerD family protein [Thermoguttaceae bacterium]|nr:TerD family protein [Thermoguttaceae bacterium]
MAVLLSAGETVSLPGLKKVKVALGWEASPSNDPFDLDASCFMLGANNKVRDNNDLIFPNNKRSRCGSVVHQGDDKTGGDGDADNETIEITLEQVPSDIVRLVFTASIHKATAKGLNFGLVHRSFIRVIDLERSEEISRFDLSTAAKVCKSVIFGELVREEGRGMWMFRAIGQGWEKELPDIAKDFGVIEQRDTNG